MSRDLVQGRYDVVVVGAGHNGLVAAAYLARAGLSVLVLERLGRVGGAATSEQPFGGVPARLSTYSYLVSLLPDQIARDLDLDVELRSRRTSSYTPTLRGGRATGLLVEREPGPPTRRSFRELTGSDREYDAWQAFYGEVGDLARVVAPTMLRPLLTASEMRARVEARTWAMLVEEPLGAVLRRRFADDLVRGVVATDGLIGTFADLEDPGLAPNRCFLYHLVGNGTGEWRVPVGGMGAVTNALEHAARRHGATVATGVSATAIEADGQRASVVYAGDAASGSVQAGFVLGNLAPAALAGLVGRPPAERPEGSQLKVNMLLERLPRLRSGVSPVTAFAGTLHVAEGYDELQAAYAEAAAGRLPAALPGELYCHTLTDPSILGPLAASGMHSLTYFGLHTPARLFEEGLDHQRDEAVQRMLDAVNQHLVEPLESLLAVDAQGRPCLEAKAPQDVERSVGMPGGHIFHGDLSWPWAPDDAMLDTPARRWGVATDAANVLLCGAGARRGGGISGIGGHNAAMAVLESLA